MTAVPKQLALVVLVLALVLSGCSAISGDEAPAGAGEEVAQATEAPEPTATAVEEPTATPEPTEVAIGPPPAFREDLQATDPATVVLGAGTPQVVELFAFW